MSPKLSIVTIVYNGEDVLEGTIKSVVSQTYPSIEYIIVDGASKDGTLEIIQKYKEHIDILVSEPDKGLYDAMNKGISLATGDYLWFMNAGDHIPNPQVVEQIFKNDTDGDVYYGECMFVDDDRKHLGLRSEQTPHQLPQHLNWKDMARGMVVSHQSFILRRELAPPYIENNLSADIDWVIVGLKRAKKIIHTQMVISEYLVGGLSKQKHFQSLKDRFVVLQKHFGFFPNIIHHIRIVLRRFI